MEESFWIHLDGTLIHGRLAPSKANSLSTDHEMESLVSIRGNEGNEQMFIFRQRWDSNQGPCGLLDQNTYQLANHAVIGYLLSVANSPLLSTRTDHLVVLGGIWARITRIQEQRLYRQLNIHSMAQHKNFIKGLLHPLVRWIKINHTTTQISIINW